MVFVTQSVSACASVFAVVRVSVVVVSVFARVFVFVVVCVPR